MYLINSHNLNITNLQSWHNGYSPLMHDLANRWIIYRLPPAHKINQINTFDKIQNIQNQ